MMEWIRYYSLYFAWLITLIASIATLSLSEFNALEPCHLCWYQRICLFPLVIILAHATYHHFTPIVRYILILPLVGSLISLYQILIIGFTSSYTPCGQNHPCIPMKSFTSLPWMIPSLSFIAFICILVFLLLAYMRPPPQEPQDQLPK